MGFFSILKKSEAPKELPNLAMDDLKSTIQEQSRKENNIVSPVYPLQPGPQIPLASPVNEETRLSSALTQNLENYKPLPTTNILKKSAPLQSQTNEIKEDIKKNMGMPRNEKSFFKDMMKTIDDEAKNVEDLESWYQRRFSGQDIVNQMKDYWEKQKPEMVIRNVGAELKVKVKEKTEKLHNLEQEWQENYMKLLSKEEEIRQEEKQLKKMISEFVSLCEKHLGKKRKS